MVRSKTKRERFRAPLSGRVFGTVAKALGLRFARNNKALTRYLNGRAVSDCARREIITSFAEDLVEQGIIPPLRIPNDGRNSITEPLGETLAVFAEEWDSLVGNTSTLSAGVDRPDLAGAAYLRLITVDLSLRYAALLHLAGLPAPEPDTPPWADSRGGALCLRELLKRCGPEGPTRVQLAELMEVSRNTVDAWLDQGARPRQDHLDRIGDRLAPFIEGMDAQAVSGALRLHYGLSEICDTLARHVGLETVIETATAFVRLAGFAYEELGEHGDEYTDEEVALLHLIVFVTGAHGPFGLGLLRCLIDREEDPLWQAELVAAAMPWESRLIYVMKMLRDTDNIARDANNRFGIPVEFSESVLDDTLRWAQSNPSLPRKFDPGTTVYRVSGDARFSASNRLMQYESAMAVGDHDTALVHIRRAVKLQPENAMYHFLLGATLGQIGKVDEGIQECWIADALNPDDELPKVEVGIILMNAGRNPEARQHLEDTARDREHISAHLSFNLGVARFRCEAYPEAMEALDTSISQRNDYGPALDMAAQCAFAIGETKKARNLAKRAKRHGHTEAYDNWRAGLYRKKK